MSLISPLSPATFSERPPGGPVRPEPCRPGLPDFPDPCGMDRVDTTAPCTRARAGPGRRNSTRKTSGWTGGVNIFLRRWSGISSVFSLPVPRRFLTYFRASPFCFTAARQILAVWFFLHYFHARRNTIIEIYCCSNLFGSIVKANFYRLKPIGILNASFDYFHGYFGGCRSGRRKQPHPFFIFHLFSPYRFPGCLLFVFLL